MPYLIVWAGLQDVKIFKRRKWKYLILDEAHMIKNWRSQRWQALLNFSARHRLLITGTPLQVHNRPHSSELQSHSSKRVRLFTRESAGAAE